MNRVLAAAVLAASIVAVPAGAEQRPRSAGADPHVRTVAYNPVNVVRVVGSPRNSTQIIFSAGEEITQVAIGDSDAWMAQPAANLLFLKPIIVRGSTNAQVVTRRPDGTLRSYQFLLISARTRGAAPIYALNFTYPDDARLAEAAAEAQVAARELDRLAQERLTLAWAEGVRNWRYVAKGSVMIQPTEVSDNGRQTAFRFPGNLRIPTIYTAAPDGSETIVPYTVVNEVVVVQTVAREFMLRDGKQALRVVNQGFDPVGRNPGTGTGTSDLSRNVRSGS